MQPDFSKVIKLIPTYNERGNIAQLARAIFGLYPAASVLVLDDNSPDGTSQVVKNLQGEFPKLHLRQNIGLKGFGRSYLGGFKRVLSDERYDSAVMMDADFSHNPETIAPMVAALKDYDVVIGSRYVDNGGIVNWDLKRRLLSRFANWYARKISGLPIRDLTTGFMCFKKSVIKNLDLDSIHSDGYAFLVELKYKMHKAGHKILEYPIIFTERRLGQSKMSAKVIWESIWLPWKLRLGKK